MRLPEAKVTTNLRASRARSAFVALMSMLWLVPLASLLPGCAQSISNPCVSADCSGRGECRHAGPSAWCVCDDGFRPHGLACVADETVADGDLDADADVDADLDQDFDADDGDLDIDDADAGDADGDSPSIQTRDDSFDDFSRGSFPRSLANLYVAADGSIRSIHSTDVTGNGEADVVVANNFDGERFDLDSSIYEGPIERGGIYETPTYGLPTEGASGALVADFDADGSVDVLIANVGYEFTRVFEVGSPLFSGPDFDESTMLDSTAAACGVVADLDRDGYLDAVLVSGFHFDDCDDSVIHWGGAGGFSRSTMLETICPDGVAVADIDADGHLDLLFANALGARDGVEYDFDPPSYIYWGNGTQSGFRDDPARRSEIAAYNPSDISIADVDEDGRLDLVFGQNRVRPGEEPHSRVEIYWGEGERRFAEPTSLDSTGIAAISVADLDVDGHLDVVIANYFHLTYTGDSLVYWGDGTREGWGTRTTVETVGARGVFVADHDLDGYPDLFFSNFQSGAPGETGRRIYSYIYFGPDHDEEERARVETVGARESRKYDLGHVYDRGSLELYVSAVLGLENPPRRLWWSAATPLDTSIGFQLRSADTAEGVESASWTGPSSSSDWYETSGTEVHPAHRTHRFVQYRARFDLGFHRAIAILDWVGLE